MCWQQSLFALLKTAWCQILLLLYSTRWLTQNFTLEITSQHCEDAFVSPLSALLSPCLLFPNTVTDAASYEINQTSSSQPEKEAQKEKLVSWAALASLHSAVEPEPSQGPLCEALYGCQLRSTKWCLHIVCRPREGGLDLDLIHPEDGLPGQLHTFLHTSFYTLEKQIIVIIGVGIFELYSEEEPHRNGNFSKLSLKSLEKNKFFSSTIEDTIVW